MNGEKVARLYSRWHHLYARLLREGIKRLEVELRSNDPSVRSVVGSAIGADVLIDTRDDDGDPIVREEVRYPLDWDETRRHPDGG